MGLFLPRCTPGETGWTARLEESSSWITRVIELVGKYTAAAVCDLHHRRVRLGAGHRSHACDDPKSPGSRPTTATAAHVAA